MAFKWILQRVSERRHKGSGRMNILRRGVPAAKAASKKNAAQATVNQRIEVTVERETVTVLVRGQPAMSEQEAASKTAETDKIEDIARAAHRRRSLGTRLQTLEEETAANLNHAHGGSSGNNAEGTGAAERASRGVQIYEVEYVG